MSLLHQVFDFLFLVGRLEEQGYNGDSVETALLACNEKPEEVKSNCPWVGRWGGEGGGVVSYYV